MAYPHDNVQPQSKSIPSFSTQAMEGVLVDGNKKNTPPLLIDL